MNGKNDARMIESQTWNEEGRKEKMRESFYVFFFTSPFFYGI
jgi:hypothetical protein